MAAAARSRFYEVNANEGYNTPQALYNQALEYLQGNNVRGHQLPSALPELLQLIQDVFNNNKHIFDMDKSLPDPFLQRADETVTPDYFITWYNDINSEMVPMSKKKDVKIKEFFMVMSHIARDCIIMILTGYRNLSDEYRTYKDFTGKIKRITKEIETNKQNLKIYEKYSRNPSMSKNQEIYKGLINSTTQQKDNKKRKLSKYTQVLKHIKMNNNINTFKQTKRFLIKTLDDKSRAAFVQLLIDINECIKSGYQYGRAIKIFITFITRITDRINDRVDSTYNSDLKPLTDKFFEKYFRNPHIIYPTYQSISHQTVVLLTTAPICNFRIINRKREIHGEFKNAKYDFWHDVKAHCRKSHYYVSKSLYNYYNNNNNNTSSDKDKLIQHLQIHQEINRVFFDYYFCRSPKTDNKKHKLCDKSKDDYNGNGSYASLNPQQKQLIFAFILFELLHERENIIELISYNIVRNISFDRLIEGIKDRYNTPNLLKKYPFLKTLNLNEPFNEFITIFKTYILPKYPEVTKRIQNSHYETLDGR